MRADPAHRDLKLAEVRKRFAAGSDIATHADLDTQRLQDRFRRQHLEAVVSSHGGQWALGRRGQLDCTPSGRSWVVVVRWEGLTLVLEQLAGQETTGWC